MSGPSGAFLDEVREAVFEREDQRDFAIEAMRVVYETWHGSLDDRHRARDAFQMLSAALAELGAHPADDEAPAKAAPLCRSDFYEEFYDPVQRQIVEDQIREHEWIGRLERQGR